MEYSTMQTLTWHEKEEDLQEKGTEKGYWFDYHEKVLDTHDSLPHLMLVKLSLRRIPNSK